MVATKTRTAWGNYLLTFLASPWTSPSHFSLDPTARTNIEGPHTTVQGLYTPPGIISAPPGYTAEPQSGWYGGLEPIETSGDDFQDEYFYDAEHTEEYDEMDEGMDEGMDIADYPDEESNHPEKLAYISNLPAANRRMLRESAPTPNPANPAEVLMPPWGRIHPAVKRLPGGSQDKSYQGKTHRGELFNSVGCAYVGRSCSAFYFPYSYEKGYQQSFGQLDEDKTDYKWNIMASLPYIAKSPLMGTRNVHGREFDDVETSSLNTNGNVVKVTMYGTTRVTSIVVEFEGGKIITHGRQQKGEMMESIPLAKGETILGGSFYNCKHERHTRLCAATLVTTLGNIVTRGHFPKDKNGNMVKEGSFPRNTEGVWKTMVPKGFVFAGFMGRKGKNIDQIGIIAVDRRAMDAARKALPMEQFDGTVWRNTPYPGIAVSSIYGGQSGPRYKYNEAFLLPKSIPEMKMNKLVLYSRGGATCGMSFAYEGGAQISVGKTDEKATVVDLGAVGRIESIKIFRINVKDAGSWYRRVGGVYVSFTDKDGIVQHLAHGETNDGRKSQLFVVPEGTEIVAPIGTGKTRVWSIGFVVRKTTPVGASPP